MASLSLDTLRIPSSPPHMRAGCIRQVQPAPTAPPNRLYEYFIWSLNYLNQRNCICFQQKSAVFMGGKADQMQPLGWLAAALGSTWIPFWRCHLSGGYTPPFSGACYLRLNTSHNAEIFCCVTDSSHLFKTSPSSSPSQISWVHLVLPTQFCKHLETPTQLKDCFLVG